MKLNDLLAIIILSLLTFAGPVAQEAPPYDQPIDPDVYLIHPGDELQVTFVKSKLASINLEVDPEGRIVHETLGVFDLSKMTLSEARNVLVKTLRGLYRVAEIAITITAPRPAKISVLGAVRRPGLYEGYTSQRVSEIIGKAGGILRDGSRRWIVFSGGPGPLTVDLDRAAYLGDMDCDPCLYAGNTVYVPNKSSEVVQVVGEVNNPREIELVSGDDIGLLLALAGGTRSHADTGAIQVLGEAGGEHGRAVVGGAIIIVPSKSPTREDNRIAIFGAVRNPGLYVFRENMSLAQLVTDAGDFLPDASSGLTTVFRRPRVDATGRITHIRFPISNVVRDERDYVTVSLQAGDSIFVPVSVGYVIVAGEVFNPGYYPYAEGMNALHYINSSGGYLPTANRTEIGIYNPVSGITSTTSPEVLLSDGCKLIVNIREELK